MVFVRGIVGEEQKGYTSGGCNEKMTEVTHFKKASTDADTENTLSRMERDWDARAREAPEHYIASAHCRWRMDEFFQSGEINVDNYVLADAEVIWGKKPSQMRVLEIGCGAGR